MKVWRVSDHTNLSGQGGMVSAARWHQKGTPVVYCADHPATALLEKLVHVDIEDMPQGYTLITIEVPELASHRINAERPTRWLDERYSGHTKQSEQISSRASNFCSSGFRLRLSRMHGTRS